jgi:hypothetical protein
MRTLAIVLSLIAFSHSFIQNQIVLSFISLNTKFMMIPGSNDDRNAQKVVHFPIDKPSTNRTKYRNAE